MSGSFTFAGTSSADYNASIEKVPALNRPARKQTIIEIPGRSGSIVFPEDAWSNVAQTYDIFFSARNPAQAARALIEWLQGVKGYQRLTDTFDPDVYRMAYVDGSMSIENLQNAVLRTQVTFSCRPERYLLTGEQDVTIEESGGRIYNNTAFDAKPLLRVNGTGSGTLSVINGAKTYTVSISAISSYIMLDCEDQDAYKSGTNLNNNVTITSGSSFPHLGSANNEIIWTGGITSVRITPRWYEI